MIDYYTLVSGLASGFLLGVFTHFLTQRNKEIKINIDITTHQNIESDNESDNESANESSNESSNESENKNEK